MANETIELLKNYEPGKMPWPALHQQKIDGVPVIVTRMGTHCIARTRQGERVTSIPHIEQFCTAVLDSGDSVVMELHINGMAFKEISGLVRKKAASVETRKLRGWVFDFIPAGCSEQAYAARRTRFIDRLHQVSIAAEIPLCDLLCRVIPATLCVNDAEAQESHDALMLAAPSAEGSVLHSVGKTWQPGKRCWGTQRMKPVPTIDLYIQSVEEAVSAEGQPLGMVGRLNAEFTKLIDGKPVLYLIGIGPGALNHTQRKALWLQFKRGDFKPRIAEIRYMRDDSYDALRQPTFKQWRDDKVQPDGGVS